MLSVNNKNLDDISLTYLETIAILKSLFISNDIDKLSFAVYRIQEIDPKELTEDLELRDIILQGINSAVTDNTPIPKVKYLYQAIFDLITSDFFKNQNILSFQLILAAKIRFTEIPIEVHELVMLDIYEYTRNASENELFTLHSLVKHSIQSNPIAGIGNALFSIDLLIYSGINSSELSDQLQDIILRWARVDAANRALNLGRMRESILYFIQLNLLEEQNNMQFIAQLITTILPLNNSLPEDVTSIKLCQKIFLKLNYCDKILMLKSLFKLSNINVMTFAVYSIKSIDPKDIFEDLSFRDIILQGISRVTQNTSLSKIKTLHKAIFNLIASDVFVNQGKLSFQLILEAKIKFNEIPIDVQQALMRSIYEYANNISGAILSLFHLLIKNAIQNNPLAGVGNTFFVIKLLIFSNLGIDELPNNLQKKILHWARVDAVKKVSNLNIIRKLILCFIQKNLELGQKNIQFAVQLIINIKLRDWDLLPKNLQNLLCLTYKENKYKTEISKIESDFLSNIQEQEQEQQQQPLEQSLPEKTYFKSLKC